MSDSTVYVTLDALLEARRHCRELPLSGKPKHSGRQTGRQFSRLRGRGIDFDQVRLYQPGDDIRNIDWRVTARTRKAHTKVFNEERERPIFVLCEQSSRMFFGTQLCFKSVLAAEACALIAWMALAHNDRIGGMVFDAEQCHEIRPRRSRQAILQLLNRLLSGNHALQPGTDSGTPGEPLNLALRRSREVIRPGSILYLLCDHAAIDNLSQPLLNALGAHNDVVLLPIFDPLEASLPSSPALEFVQNQHRLTLNTTDTALREAWAAQFLTRQQGWQQLASRLRCGLQPLDTSRTPIEQLRQLLSTHARRRH